LREISLQPPAFELSRQGNAYIDQGCLGLGEAKELFGISNLPASALEFLLLIVSHFDLLHFLAPSYAFVVDPQFSASRSDLGQCLATWHPEVLPLLQHPEQESCFPPGRIGKWRALDLSVQPDKRFILIWHRSKLCHI